MISRFYLLNSKTAFFNVSLFITYASLNYEFDNAIFELQKEFIHIKLDLIKQIWIIFITYKNL